MTGYRLYINDLLFDLPDNVRFARTKQVNDIARLDNRQTNYTQNIKLPLTKKNRENFKHLGVIGNTSAVPYTFNTARLFNPNGECEIFDGVAIVRSTGKQYNLSIYDGYISFTKAIENKTLTDTDLSELNHLKNMANVIATWSGGLDYKYIVADYNGKAEYDNGINIDFLIPSVNLKFLWDKVHEFSGFTYSGEFFKTGVLEKHWITYPKTIGSGTQQTELLHTFEWRGEIFYFKLPPNQLQIVHSPSLIESLGVLGERVDTVDLLGTVIPVGFGSEIIELYNSFVEVKVTGLYKFTISGTINSSTAASSGATLELALGTQVGGFEYTDIGQWEYFKPFEFVHYVQITSGQSFQLAGSSQAETVQMWNTTGAVDVKVERVTGNTVDFEEAFIDFKIKDFINEVLWRFSLTPFKDKYNNNIEYLTTKEWLETTEIEDWSASKNRFVYKVSELYKLRNYGQRNYMRYKYNDENLTHNDGFFPILNKNIKDEATIVKSKLFSPEPEKSIILGQEYGVYMFWEKELNDDGTIKYKELANRFYIMKDLEVGTPITVSSEIEATTQVVASHQRESFDKLSFSQIIQEYYEPIFRILNSARVATMLIYLDDTVIANLDFKKLVYIREEASYFMVNKVPNYISKGVYKVEMIEVDRFVQENEAPQPEPSISLTSTAVVPNPPISLNWVLNSQYNFNNYTPVDGVTIKAEQYTDFEFNNGVPTGIVKNANIDESANVQNFQLPLVITEEDCKVWKITITDPNEGIESNSQEVFVLCEEPSEPPAISLFVEGNRTAPFPDPSNPLIRNVSYIFFNFTPTTATLRVVQTDFFTQQEIGTPTSYNLILNEGVTNVLNDVPFVVTGGTYYKLTLQTDSISKEIKVFIH